MTNEMIRNLNFQTVKQLRNIAKDFNITGRWDMTKVELITAISKAYSEESNAKIEEEVGNNSTNSIVENVEKSIKTFANNKKQIDLKEVKKEGTYEVKEANVKPITNVDLSHKMDYISRIDRGTLIAFQVGTKVYTAMVTNKSVSRGLIKAETKLGVEFIIPFKDILWVKTGKRWPKGIYLLLKGGKTNETR